MLKQEKELQVILKLFQLVWFVSPKAGDQVLDVQSHMTPHLKWSVEKSPFLAAHEGTPSPVL